MPSLSPHKATAWVSMLFAVGLFAGTSAGKLAVDRATARYVPLEPLVRVLEAVEDDYVEEIDGEALLDAAIRGVVQDLDPHSRWMTADAAHSLRADADGIAPGFGIEVEVCETGLSVIAVRGDSAAAREGLSTGDRLLAIDGVSLVGVSVAEAQRRFKGEFGEIANLEVMREGWASPRVLATAREAVPVEALEVAEIGSDALYVRFIDFQRGAADELRALLLAPRPVPIRRLVLDLRDNTGGLLSEAVGVADLFVSQGTIVSVESRHTAPETYVATSESVPDDLSIALLVNGYSASASEIVAGVVQESGRGILVGSRTYGKGSVQQLYRHPDGAALKLTVARYHLPSGASITPRDGLVPDVVVGPGTRNGAVRWSIPVAERHERDPVVAAALDALR